MSAVSWIQAAGSTMAVGWTGIYRGTAGLGFVLQLAHHFRFGDQQAVHRGACPAIFATEPLRRITTISMRS